MLAILQQKLTLTEDSTMINPFGLGFFEASGNEKTSLQTINLQTRVGGATKVI